MTIHKFMKYVFVLMGLMGTVFFGAGVWEMWSAYDFSKTAVKFQGTFSGYHVEWRLQTTKPSSGMKKKVKYTYPMFEYSDAKGKTHRIIGTDVVVFEWLKAGDKVDVLVSPDDPKNARLGSFYYLYSSGGYFCIGGILAIMLLFYVFKAISPFLTASTIKLPGGDLAIVGGGFLLLGGAMIGFGTYFIYKLQDPALVQAMEAGEFETAHELALEGRGIEGKNSDGETALIVALKANKPEVTRAMLGHWLWPGVNVRSSKGVSGLSLAAANGDHQTLSMMIKKGAEMYDLKPSVVFGLIFKGDVKTLNVIFSSSFNLDDEYNRLTYGDFSVMHDKAEIVRLIQKHKGLFKAPESFIALVLDDQDTLRAALKKPGACKKKFNGFTVSKFAKKIGKYEMLEKTGSCIESK